MSSKISNKPKILHLVAGAGVGGAELTALDAIKALHDAGVVEQHVICRDFDNYIEEFEKRGIPYDVLKYNHLERITGKASRIIKAKVKEFQPALVHSWMGRASSFVPKNLNIPVLGWFGGYYKLKRYKNCQYYVGVTRDIKRYLDEETGQPDKCFTVHTIGTLEKDAPVTREEFDIPDGAPLILLLSRMHWMKGIDTFLHAMQKLDGYYALLAGNGPEDEKYQKLAKELGVDNRVRFLGWRDDSQALLGVADVCALPSRYETFGTAMAESWFSGVPLVATLADGARQYVTHEKDGLVCEIDDVDGLVEQLKRAYEDKELRKSLIDSGKETYDKLFSKEVAVKSYIDMYQKVINDFTQ